MFVAVDIIGAVPMFLALTKHLEPSERKEIVKTSMLVAFGVALIFMAVGQPLLRHLGITLFDFKVAGGLVLLLIALAHIFAGPQSTQDASGSTGVVPLAMPLITGPAMLTTLVLEVGTKGYMITFAAMFLNYLIAYVALMQCDRIQRLLGKDGTVVASKVAALLLAAIAISMMRSGLYDAIRDFIATK